MSVQEAPAGTAGETKADPPAPTFTIERRRLAEPRLVSPAEAEALFRERVIELG